MPMSEKSVHTQRALYSWEIQEAKRVFHNRLDYDIVRIHENATWPNLPHRASLMLRRLPHKGVLNAITLGNHLYFPIQLLKEPVPFGHSDFYKLLWLIHELTHAWQFQCIGWRYLASALNVQIRLGAAAYDFGNEDGLRQNHAQGYRLVDFNLEQQADIASSYYRRLVQQADVSAWQPFIREFHDTLV